jgi:hypothetical protein
MTSESVRGRSGAPVYTPGAEKRDGVSLTFGSHVAAADEVIENPNAPTSATSDAKQRDFIMKKAFQEICFALE